MCVAGRGLGVCVCVCVSVSVSVCVCLCLCLCRSRQVRVLYGGTKANSSKRQRPDGLRRDLANACEVSVLRLCQLLHLRLQHPVLALTRHCSGTSKRTPSHARIRVWASYSVCVCCVCVCCVFPNSKMQSASWSPHRLSSAPPLSSAAASGGACSAPSTAAVALAAPASACIKGQQGV